MNNKKNKINAIALIAVIILASFVWVFKRCNQSRQEYGEREITTTAGEWRRHKLIYTKHARCRMECREITEYEVEYVLSTGVINQEKSKEADEEAKGSCPTYALEANTKDGQHVRVIFGACDKITKVITAIDLGEEHPCNCR